MAASRSTSGSARAAPSAPPPPIPDTSLAGEAQRRYLSYALSVITARALPDVRDGLKPVQRRILYAMHHDLHLGPEAKFRKSAAVVGDVMGKYHPHGDVAIYDAMVRLAQPFVMRAPLVEGHGNFGSPDGDAPAAMRYTEARLRPLAIELLSELGQGTVPWRPNYDGTRSEPVVLPARFPNLLVNGSQGIAVGMATSIPPHNPSEVIDACIALINQDDLPLSRVLSHIKGPDFPTGGELTATKKELEAIYASGQGSLRLRSEWRLEEEDGRRAPQIIVTSIPYGVERREAVEKIAEIIVQKKLGGLADVRDESSTDVRVVMEIKRGTDPQLVMAYLYKNTPLSVHVAVNLTCLVPAPQTPPSVEEKIDQDDDLGPPLPVPRRLGLVEILKHFLAFRFETVTARTRFERDELNRKIHVLEGFERVFDVLDQVIKIIRASEGRADAASKLMKKFSLSEAQADAILELRLYRLAKLEILAVQKELGERRAEAKRLAALLASEDKRWALVADELKDLKARFGDKRRTKITGTSNEPEFQEADFIADEDANVILSAQGWVKRVREVKDLSATRLREGDSVLAVVAGSTRSSVAFFSNLGGCYVCRVHDVPQSTGYGDPVQKLFKLADGERMIAALSFDPRVIKWPAADEGEGSEERVLDPLALAVTKSGFGFRFSLQPHKEPSTRAGRRFAKPKDGDEVILVHPTGDRDLVMCASSDGHVLAVKVADIPALAGAGKGVLVISVEDGERLVGATPVLSEDERVTIETEKGKPKDVAARDVLGARANKGTPIVKRDKLTRIALPPPVVPSLVVT